jgi:hypothetical protein
MHSLARRPKLQAGSSPQQRKIVCHGAEPRPQENAQGPVRRRQCLPRALHRSLRWTQFQGRGRPQSRGRPQKRAVRTPGSALGPATAAQHCKVLARRRQRSSASGRGRVTAS